ncbi:MAG: phenylalanine--tRNA ligase subunit beta, partial [Herbiconiux sp.]|nr:phenylalanine--tRNA ligase subunit beta [Herbiconiux sp.]
AQPAAARVVELLETLAGGTADGLGSLHHEHPELGSIVLPFGYVQRLIGVDFTSDETARSLREIGAEVEETEGGFVVTPPSWRPDITDRASLAEEAARIVGYDRIPSILPVAPPGRGLTTAQLTRRRTADVLAAGGLTEVLAYPFLSAAQNALFGSPTPGEEVPAIRVANPLDSEAALLRTSLLPGLVDIARRNLSRGLTDLALFEIGLVFRPEAGRRYGQDALPQGAVLPTESELAELHAGIPPQPRHVGALVLGNAVDKQPGQPAVPAGIADVLDVVRLLGSALAVELQVRPGSHKALHPGRTAEIVVTTPAGEVAVGFAGEILPTVTAELDLPRVVAVAELDLDALIAAAGAGIEVAPISGYPAATQDLSLVVDAAVPAGEVEAAVAEGAGALLESIRLVDDYRGSGVPEGSKSLTFALRFRAPDRTLTAAEASEAKLAGSARAHELFGATIRE